MQTMLADLQIFVFLLFFIKGFTRLYFHKGHINLRPLEISLPISVVDKNRILETHKITLYMKKDCTKSDLYPPHGGFE